MKATVPGLLTGAALLVALQSGQAFASPRAGDVSRTAAGGITSRDTVRPASGSQSLLELRGQVDPHDLQSWRFQLDLPTAAPLALTCDEQGGSRERHQVRRESARHHAVTVRGLKASTRYRCQASLRDGSSRRSSAVELVTAALPQGLVPPSITVPSSDLPGTGYTLYNYGMLLPFYKYRSPHLVITDAEGNVRWYYAGVGGGDIDTTYLGNDEVIFGGWAGSYFKPTIVGLDKQVKFTATDKTSVPWEQAGQFNHDANLTQDGKAVLTLVTSLIDDTWRGFVIKEIDRATNQVVWFWDSQTDGVAEGILGEGSDQVLDPYHNNSVMDRMENGRRYLYVGLRDYHQVFKIDYATKELVWRIGVDGDFTLLEADGREADLSRWFFNQHDAQMVGNRLTVYDNGSDRGDYGGNAYSRALQLEIDETRRTARIVFEYTEPSWFEPAWGGHDLLDSGNSLVALGHCWSCGGTQRPSALIEVSPAGKVVWRGDWENNRVAIYRADRIGGCEIFNNTTYCPTLKD